MEDIVIYLDREKAMDSLKKKWGSSSLLEYKVENGVAGNFICFHLSNEKGDITHFKL